MRAFLREAPGRMESRPTATTVRLAVAIVLAATVITLPAQAQQNTGAENAEQASQVEDIARALFATAKAEYEAGQYDKALQHFQEAYLQSKRPQLLYNVGLAADRLRYNRTALEAFERYLKELPDAGNRVEVQNRVRALHEVVDREAAASKTTGGMGAPVAAVTRVSGQPPQAVRGGDGGLISKWWFWTAVGVVAASVVTGVAVASSGNSTGKPVPGSDGVVVLTLSRQ